MTTSSTASKAGNDNKVSVQERPHGITRVCEDEFYHLTALINDCLDEAGVFVRKVHNKAGERFTDYRGEKNTEPLDMSALAEELLQAHDCLIIALQYLD